MSKKEELQDNKDQLTLNTDNLRNNVKKVAAELDNTAVKSEAAMRGIKGGADMFRSYSASKPRFGKKISVVFSEIAAGFKKHFNTFKTWFKKQINAFKNWFSNLGKKQDEQTSPGVVNTKIEPQDFETTSENPLSSMLQQREIKLKRGVDQSQQLANTGKQYNDATDSLLFKSIFESTSGVMSKGQSGVSTFFKAGARMITGVSLDMKKYGKDVGYTVVANQLVEKKARSGTNNDWTKGVQDYASSMLKAAQEHERRQSSSQSVDPNVTPK